ncbi:MAG TPA: hypothetical protein PKA90_14160 [Ignavibacteria bacterium]|nr:hypothetical protein [Ignavibacteria bacterium]HMR41563.1 hypothetical protein [Ignavibacteria bacterium]
MKCNFKKSNNEVCKNNALLNDTKCYWHSKAIPESEKNMVRSAGGKNKIIKVRSNFLNHELNNISDVLKLNTLLINGVLQNKIDLRIATGITYMLNLQIKGIELSAIENKIHEMENMIIKIKLPEEIQ